VRPPLYHLSQEHCVSSFPVNRKVSCSFLLSRLCLLGRLWCDWLSLLLPSSPSSLVSSPSSPLQTHLKLWIRFVVLALFLSIFHGSESIPELKVTVPWRLYHPSRRRVRGVPPSRFGGVFALPFLFPPVSLETYSLNKFFFFKSIPLSTPSAGFFSFLRPLL